MPPISQAARTAQDLIGAGRAADAVGVLQGALRRQARDAHAHALLGLALASLGQFERAVFHAQRARELALGDADVLGYLGSVYAMTGRPRDAVAVYRNALAASPDHLNSLEGLATLLALEQEHGEVEGLMRRALELRPRDGPFTAMLAGARHAVGRGDEALAIIEDALARAPDDTDLLHARAACMNSVPGVDPGQISAAHFRHGEAISAQSGEPLPPPAPRRPGPTRVGLVSGDFRAHSVASFLGPLLSHLDRSRVEPMAFSTNAARDGVTDALRPRFAEWHDLFALDDPAAARLIRSCDVDVLIDLCGLTAGERLGVFALRPARVQATYLGYPNTTGLKEMDWRIVDAVTDPPGFEDRCTERLARTDGCFICFGPLHGSAPEPAARGHGEPVTFASFNVLTKVHDGVIALWSRILNGIPGARLLLKAAVLRSEATRADLRGRFERAGLAPDRLDLMGWVADNPIGLYERVDVALDPFPYNGTTTTCEALWMGVPVVTLAGETHAGRVGASLLTHAGLAELVAASMDDYARIATDLALNTGHRAEYRRTLRRRVHCTIADGASFARRFERLLAEIAGTATSPT